MGNTSDSFHKVSLENSSTIFKLEDLRKIDFSDEIFYKKIRDFFMEYYRDEYLELTKSESFKEDFGEGYIKDKILELTVEVIKFNGKIVFKSIGKVAQELEEKDPDLLIKILNLIIGEKYFSILNGQITYIGPGIPIIPLGGTPIIQETPNKVKKILEADDYWILQKVINLKK